MSISSFPGLQFGFQRSRPSRASIARWTLYGLAVGSLLAAYRNDMFLDIARIAGYEAAYLKEEAAMFGGPPSGSPRELEPILAEAHARLHAPTKVDPAALGTNDDALATPKGAVAPVSGSKAPEAPSEDRPGEQAKAQPQDGSVVALDSLPVLEQEREATPSNAAPVAAPAPRAPKATRQVVPRSTPKAAAPQPTKRPAPRNALDAAIRKAMEGK